MKKSITIIFILIFLTSCAKTPTEMESESLETTTEATTEIITTTTTTAITTAAPPDTTPTATDETAVIEEELLANGAVLLVEHQSNGKSKVSIRIGDNLEPQFLLDDWDSLNYKISPDLSKIAYIINSEKVNSGSLYIYDVNDNKSTFLEFNEYSEEDESKGMIWLDNEILLSIGLQSHYGWSSGGSVYYYNIADDSNKKIIPHDIRRFQITKLEIGDEKLGLSFLLDSDVGNAFANTFNGYQNIPLTKIYELIENNETFIIDVSDIRENE